jgi:predicted dehydrogenase
MHPRQDRAQESDCHLILSYASGMSVHVYVSWTSPVKVRRLVVVGTERMALYDLLDPEPLKVFDQGVYPTDGDGESGPLFSYKTGPTTAVELPTGGEDLARMIDDFARSVQTGVEPRSNAALGLDVVRILAAAQKSLEHDGAKIALDAVSPNPLLKLRARLRPR